MLVMLVLGVWTLDFLVLFDFDYTQYLSSVICLSWLIFYLLDLIYNNTPVNKVYYV
jgi:hypothetical protein